MKEFIEDMETLTDGIKDILEYTISKYSEFSDEYDFVNRVYEFAESLTNQVKEGKIK